MTREGVESMGKYDAKLECWATDELVCPYCGRREDESWEIRETDCDEFECSSCGKVFMYSAEVRLEFTSWEVEDGSDGR